MTVEDARKITPEEWDQFPAKPARPPDQWAPLMDALEHGEIYTLPYSDDNDLRGKRIGLGRRASQREFKLEIRTKDSTMAVRRADAVAPSPTQAKRPTSADQPTRGRRSSRRRADDALTL